MASRLRKLLYLSYQLGPPVYQLIDVGRAGRVLWESEYVHICESKCKEVLCVQHRLNMELDLQSLFRLLCTAILIG